MSGLIILVLAFTPGVFWLWFFARRDVYRPEPRRLLALTFFFGMVATVPAVIIEGLFLDDSILSEKASLASVAAGMLFVVGPVEELTKFAAVRLGPYRTLYFDEPTDGLVYAAAASLGFASLENLGYVLVFGPTVMLGRAPLSTLAHVVFGSLWGYPLGLQTQRRTGGFFLVVGGLVVAAAVHATFNVAVFSDLWPVAIGLVVVGTIWTLRRFDWTQRMSPFRYRRNYPRIQCHSCGQLIRLTSRFCHYCGVLAAPPHEALYCGHCDARNRSQAAFCTQCGDQLLEIRRGRALSTVSA